MPFVAYGSSPEFKAEQFCCLQVGGKWKLHHFDGENWKRINTWLPNDSTECSPTAEFIDGKWQISFIAGGATPERKFRLYKIADLKIRNQKLFAKRKSALSGRIVLYLASVRVGYTFRTQARRKSLHLPMSNTSTGFPTIQAIRMSCLFRGNTRMASSFRGFAIRLQEPCKGFA